MLVIAMEVNVNVNDVFRILKQVCETPSPSGYEKKLVDLLVREIEPYADELWIDPMGNLIAKKSGKGEGKVMIAAHMDEIGLMINNIDKNGFLRFVPVGGWNEKILMAQRVLILTMNGKTIRGIIGVKPPHLQRPEEKEKVVPIKDLFIDIGVNSADEAKKLGITVGGNCCARKNSREIRQSQHSNWQSF